MEIHPHLTIISPIYFGEKTVAELVSRVESAVKAITPNFEIILIDDRSPDHSWEVMKELANERSYLKCIRLSRNFGQHYAITAGLDMAKGDWVVVMDCDLQDLPEEIPNLYAAASKGFEGVLAKRVNRKDHWFKRSSSWAFYGILGYLTGNKQDHSVANFGIYSRKLISQVRGMKESIRYFPTMVRWVGFSTTSIDVRHSGRESGRSGYNFRRLMNLALDIMLAYSDRPIRLVIKTGFLIALVSFGFIVWTAVEWWQGKIQVLGYSSLIISIWFLSGCILTTLGMIGLYVGKIFEGVKNRPIYIVDETCN